jgi:hypothetical protein
MTHAAVTGAASIERSNRRVGTRGRGPLADLRRGVDFPDRARASNRLVRDHRITMHLRKKSCCRRRVNAPERARVTAIVRATRTWVTRDINREHFGVLPKPYPGRTQNPHFRQNTSVRECRNPQRNLARMKTPMACSRSTFQKEPTYRFTRKAQCSETRW